MRYLVWSLDVWGHAPSECTDYGCPCVTVADPGDGCDCEAHEAVTHDDDHCECSFEVNDRSRIGRIDVDGEASDEQIIAALIDAGYLTEEARAGAEIDDPSCMGESFYVQDAETSEPLFELEKVEELAANG